MNYKATYDLIVPHLDKVSALDRIVKKIQLNQYAYKNVADTTTVPWYVVAAIHYRESGLSYDHHLHNGDPLTERTVHVPAGRPIKGDPPFTWEESAIDALKMSWLSSNKNWEIGNMLALLERYNGLGYKKKGLPSPYVWSWTDAYHAGKYISDGTYNANVVDQQCGCALIIKYLI